MSHRCTIQLSPAVDTGLTVVAKVYDDANTLADTVACPETAVAARYSGTSGTALADGVYEMVFLDDGNSLLGSGLLVMKGGAEVSATNLANLDSSVAGVASTATTINQKIGTPTDTLAEDLGGVRTQTDAVKTKTDQLTFSTPGLVDSSATATFSGTVEANVTQWNNSAVGAPPATSSASLTITPFVATTSNPRYTTADRAPIAQHSAPADVFTIKDGQGNSLNLTGKSLRYVVSSVDDEGDADDRTDDELTAGWKYETGGSGITLSGSGSNVVTVQHAASNNATCGEFRYHLWNVSDALLLAKGEFLVEPATFNT